MPRFISESTVNGSSAWLNAATFLGLFAVSACGDEPPSDPAPVVQPRGPVEAAEITPDRRLYDAEGELLGSGEDFGGFELPRGLTLLRGLSRQATYSTRVPAEKLYAYIGARLERVEATPQGPMVVYAASKVRGAESDDRRHVQCIVYPGTSQPTRLILRVTEPRPRGTNRLDIEEEIERQMRTLD